MSKKKIIIVLVIAVLLIIGTVIFGLKNNSHRTGQPNDLNKLSDIIISEKTKDYALNINVSMTGVSEIDREITDYVNTTLVDVKDAALYASDEDDFYPYELNIKSQRFEQQGITSIVLFITDYMGGAHNEQYYKTWVYIYPCTVPGCGLVNYSFRDLFFSDTDPLSVIYPIVYSSLRDKMGNPNPETILLSNGNGEDDYDNYKNFALFNGRLIIYFDAGEVGAYAYGPLSVEIPLEQLSNVIQPKFISSVMNEVLYE